MNFLNIFWLIWIIQWTILKTVHGDLPRQIKIAAIFEQNGDKKHKLAFTHAVNRINREQNVLRGKTLKVEIIPIPPGNRFVHHNNNIAIIAALLSFSNSSRGLLDNRYLVNRYF